MLEKIPSPTKDQIHVSNERFKEIQLMQRALAYKLFRGISRLDHVILQSWIRGGYADAFRQWLDAHPDEPLNEADEDQCKAILAEMKAFKSEI